MRKSDFSTKNWLVHLNNKWKWARIRISDISIIFFSGIDLFHEWFSHRKFLLTSPNRQATLLRTVHTIECDYYSADDGSYTSHGIYEMESFDCGLLVGYALDSLSSNVLPSWNKSHANLHIIFSVWVFRPSRIYINFLMQFVSPDDLSCFAP